MREGFRGFMAGMLAAGSVASGSGEAMAQPPQERVEHHESSREVADLAWAREAQGDFSVALSRGDATAMADAVRAFTREYHSPTQGKLIRSNQGNPMRVLDPGEWRKVRDVAIHFLANSSSWGKEYPRVQQQLQDVIARIDARLDEPGPTNVHKIDNTPQGKIDRSNGYK